MTLIFAERAWEDERPWRASDANLLERVDAPIKGRADQGMQARPVQGRRQA